MEQRRSSSAPENFSSELNGSSEWWQGRTPCAPVRDQLSQYVDGVLAPSEAGALELHLRHCDDCRCCLLEEQILVATVIEALEPMVPTPQQTERLRRDFRAALERGGPRASAQSWTNRGSWVAAALVLISLGLTAVLTRPTSQPSRANRGALGVHSPVPEAPFVFYPPAELVSPAEVSSETVPLEGVASTILLGDLDADGQFSALDLRLLCKLIDGFPGEPPCAAAGDFDGDSRLTPNDLSMAFQALNTLASSERFGAWSPQLGLACANVCP